MDVLIHQKPHKKTYVSYYVTVLLIIFSLQTCSVLLKSNNEDGILYIWREGDALKDVASKYSVDVLELKSMNDIYDENDLSSGMALFIPGNFLPSAEDIRSAENPIPQNSLDKSEVNPKQNGKNFLWPAGGSISSKYGRRRSRMHYGIDIRSDRGRDIVAAQDGVIQFAGKRRSFGNIIIIKHNKHYRSLYAHNKINYAKKGDVVRKGQKIARMGQTGRATGVHLHFELHYNNKPVNPIAYLP